MPYKIECAPVALLPITPPIVARSAEAGSGPNCSPCLVAARFKSARTTPGSTTAVRASGNETPINRVGHPNRVAGSADWAYPPDGRISALDLHAGVTKCFLAGRRWPVPLPALDRLMELV